MYGGYPVVYCPVKTFGGKPHPFARHGNPYTIMLEFHLWRGFYHGPRPHFAELITGLNEGWPVVNCHVKTLGGKSHPFDGHGNPYTIMLEFQLRRGFYHGPRPDFAELVTAKYEGYPVVYCPVKTFGGKPHPFARHGNPYTIMLEFHLWRGFYHGPRPHFAELITGLNEGWPVVNCHVKTLGGKSHPFDGHGNPYTIMLEFQLRRGFYHGPRPDFAELVTAKYEGYPVVYCPVKTFGGKPHPFARHGNPYTIMLEFHLWRGFYHGPRPHFAELITGLNEGWPVVNCHVKTLGGKSHPFDGHGNPYTIMLEFQLRRGFYHGPRPDFAELVTAKYEGYPVMYCPVKTFGGKPHPFARHGNPYTIMLEFHLWRGFYHGPRPHFAELITGLNEGWPVVNCHVKTLGGKSHPFDGHGNPYTIMLEFQLRRGFYHGPRPDFAELVTAKYEGYPVVYCPVKTFGGKPHPFARHGNPYTIMLEFHLWRGFYHGPRPHFAELITGLNEGWPVVNCHVKTLGGKSHPFDGHGNPYTIMLEFQLRRGFYHGPRPDFAELVTAKYEGYPVMYCPVKTFGGKPHPFARHGNPYTIMLEFHLWRGFYHGPRPHFAELITGLNEGWPVVNCHVKTLGGKSHPFDGHGNPYTIMLEFQLRRGFYHGPRPDFAELVTAKYEGYPVVYCPVKTFGGKPHPFARHGNPYTIMLEFHLWRGFYHGPRPHFAELITGLNEGWPVVNCHVKTLGGKSHPFDGHGNPYTIMLEFQLRRGFYHGPRPDFAELVTAKYEGYPVVYCPVKTFGGKPHPFARHGNPYTIMLEFHLWRGFYHGPRPHFAELITGLNEGWPVVNCHVKTLGGKSHPFDGHGNPYTIMLEFQLRRGFYHGPRPDFAELVTAKYEGYPVMYCPVKTFGGKPHPFARHGNPYTIMLEFHLWRGFYHGPRPHFAELITGLNEGWPVVNCHVKTLGGKSHPFDGHGNPYTIMLEFQLRRGFYHGPRPDFAELVTAKYEGYPVMYCPVKTFGGKPHPFARHGNPYTIMLEFHLWRGFYHGPRPHFAELITGLNEGWPVVNCHVKTLGGKSHPFDGHGNPYTIMLEFQLRRGFYHGPRPDFAELVTAKYEGYPVVYCPVKTFGGKPHPFARHGNPYTIMLEFHL